jgi:hypothetical protein
MQLPRPVFFLPLSYRLTVLLIRPVYANRDHPFRVISICTTILHILLSHCILQCIYEAKAKNPPRTTGWIEERIQR